MFEALATDAFRCIFNLWQNLDGRHCDLLKRVRQLCEDDPGHLGMDDTASVIVRFTYRGKPGEELHFYYERPTGKMLLPGDPGFYEAAEGFEMNRDRGA